MTRPEMKYRRLGRSNLEVSVLCLGTMMFGDQTDEAEAMRIVADARDLGVNFIDTADVYTKGASERMVGRCLAGERERWVLASKFGNIMGDGKLQTGQFGCVAGYVIKQYRQDVRGQLGIDQLNLGQELCALLWIIMMGAKGRQTYAKSQMIGLAAGGQRPEFG